MPVFPRATRALSRYATVPRFPEALQSWGQSGKGQLRATVSLGREWSEMYPLLDTARPAVRALLAAINQSIREGTLWDVQHPYLNRRVGDPGAPGTPLVNGAGQTGSTLNIDGLWVNDGFASDAEAIGISASPWLPNSTPVVVANDAIAPDGTLTATRVTDDNAGAIEMQYRQITVANDSAVHLGGIYLRKRALGGVYSGLRITYTGGVSVAYTITVNPEDGTLIHNGAAAGVIDVDDDWWFIWVAGANNSTGNTTFQLLPSPAAASTLSTTWTNAPTGTSHFWGGRIQLNTSTPTLPVKPWLHAGELIHVAGAPVVLDVAATAVLLGATHALSIHPPIFAGQSPADNAVVTVDPTAFYFKAHLVRVDNFPDIDTTGYLEAGLTLHWREQPA